MIRDQYGIIVQPNYDYKNQFNGTWDEGDSAFSTGLMSFGKSEQDYQLMPLFIKDGKLVRHPYSTKNTGDAPHNDPAATSADQVICFFSGILGRKNVDPKLIEACLFYARAGRVNKDWLSPSNRYFLFLCAGVQPEVNSKLAKTVLMAELMWNCFVKPRSEVQRPLVICKGFGDWWLSGFYFFHPDLIGSMKDYFCGWRDRAEIYYRIRTVVTETIQLKSRLP